MQPHVYSSGEFILPEELSTIAHNVVMDEKGLGGYHLAFTKWAVSEATTNPNARFTLVSFSCEGEDEATTLGDTVSQTPGALLAFVNKDHQSVIFAEDSNAHTDLFMQAGFRFDYESKWEKRAGIWTRPAPAFTAIPGTLNVLELDPAEFFSTLVLHPDTMARAIDGMIVGRSSIRSEMIKDSGEGLPSRLRDRFQARLRYNVHNFRGVIAGQGFMKGQIFWLKDSQFDALYGKDYDLVQMEGEFKGAITHETHTLLLSQPQMGHHTLNINSQSLMLGKVTASFARKEMVVNLQEQSEAILNIGNEHSSERALFGDVDDLLDGMADIVEAGGNISNFKRMNMRGTELTLRGIHPLAIPDVVKPLAKFETQILRPNGKTIKYRVGGVHIQVISQAAAKMIGYTEDVAPDTIRFWHRYNVAVVNTNDYITHVYVNSGGCDHDDFFDIILGRDNRVLAWRNPSTRREYNTFTLVGEWPVEATDMIITDDVVKLYDAEAMGRRIRTNTLHDDEADTMLRAADALAYRELPEGSPMHTGGHYTFDHFKAALAGHFAGNGTVDQAVFANLVMEFTNGGLNGLRLCSMEDKVDTYTQGGSSAARNAINDESLALIAEAVNRAVDGTGNKLDPEFVKRRNIGFVYKSATGNTMPKSAIAPKVTLTNHTTPIDMGTVNWFDHLIQDTQAYTRAFQKDVLKKVQDKAMSLAPDCIHSKYAHAFYGFDGMTFGDGVIRIRATEEKDENGMPTGRIVHKRRPKELCWGAARILCTYRSEFAATKRAEEAEIESIKGSDKLSADDRKRLIEATSARTFDIMEITALQLFNDQNLWTPVTAIDKKKVNSREMSNITNAGIRATQWKAFDINKENIRYAAVLGLARACYLIPTGEGTINFQIFANNELWNLLMDAFCYFDENILTMDQIWEDAVDRHFDRSLGL